MIELLDLREVQVLRQVSDIGEGNEYIAPVVDAIYVLKIVEKMERKINEVVAHCNSKTP